MADNSSIQWTDARVKKVREALRPKDRLGAGGLIHAGYVPSNVADLVHLLCCALTQLLERNKQGHRELTRIKKTKAEIRRLIKACDVALRQFPGAGEGR